MNTNGIDLEAVIAELRRVEKWLSESLGVADELPERRHTNDPFAAPDDLNHLKDAIDRIRPLLWVLLSRQSEVRQANLRKQPVGVRSLMDDAMSISDRHLGSGSND